MIAALRWSPRSSMVDDLSCLELLDEEALVTTLRRRYEADHLYVRSHSLLEKNIKFTEYYEYIIDISSYIEVALVLNSDDLSIIVTNTCTVICFSGILYL